MALGRLIMLNQSTPKPVYFSGWSRAVSTSGNADNDYSLYMDVIYTDGSTSMGQILRFDPTNSNWHFREGFITPAKPIKSILLFVLFRNNHGGTAWFDDLTIRELQTGTEILDFDTVRVVTTQSTPYSGAPLALTTGDGLALTLASDGGAVTGVSLGGVSVHDASHAYASGFFVRDVKASSDFVHVGGTVQQVGEHRPHIQVQSRALNLGFNAAYTVSSDRITIDATVADTSSAAERALTLYFALPVAANGWTWGDDIRTSRKVERCRLSSPTCAGR